MVLGTGEVEAFGETTRFGQAIDISELRELRSETIVGGTLGELRDAVLSGDRFREAIGQPFLK